MVRYNHLRAFVLPVSNPAFFVSAAVLLILQTCGAFFTAQAQDSREGSSIQTPLPKSVLPALTEKERVWLREHPVIRAAQDPGWPPVEFADAQGEPVGMSRDYLTLAGNRLGISFELVRNLSWQESYARMKRWEIDMTTSVTQTPERSEFWAFTKPYMTIPIVILTRADVTYISSMHQLSGKQVAVVEGYVSSENIPNDFPFIQLVNVPSVKDGLELLQRGKVFALIDNMLVISYYLTQMELSGLKIAGETPYVNAQSMAVRKDWAILAGILQKALDSITEEERSQIYSQWVPLRYEYGFDYKLLWQAIGVFSLILTGFIVWNRKLSSEIRHRKEIEAALRQSQKRFHQLFDTTPIPLCFVDENGVLTDYNKRFVQTLGYTSKEIPTLEKWWPLVYPDEDYRRWVIETWQTAVTEAVRNKSDIEPHEYRVTCKSGEVRIMEISGITMGDNFLAVFFDVTERKRAEEEQENLRSQLVQSQKMESVGRLAGGVAHDFNNMLSVILGYSELTLAKMNPSESLYANLQEVQKAAQRSAGLTRQLLAFARKQVVDPKVLNLNDIVSNTLKMLGRLIGENIALKWNPYDNLWPVKIDPSQIDQILANLVVNARDAIRGVGKVTIETNNAVFDETYCATHSECSPGEYVLLAVSDNGCGMDKETLEHIFEPFFTTKEMGKGTGLGLATVYGAVRQNDGLITIYSEMDRGTIFRIYLPRHVGEGGSAQLNEPDKAAEHGNETILLVEDEPAILKLSKMMLEELGYTVLTANSPGEAVELAGSCNRVIHLLMTDVILPEMNGRDLAQKLNLKCLFMSGYTADVITHHGVLDDGVHFIQKPFSIHDLTIKLRQALKD